jgi:hypothetical protein
MPRFILALALMSLAGCSSINRFVEDHPKTMAIGSALIIGSLMASADGGTWTKPTPEAGVPPAPCAPNPERCR